MSHFYLACPLIRKIKEKKRKSILNNDLAILPSHDNKSHLRSKFVTTLVPDGVPLFNLGWMWSWLVEYTDFLLKFMVAFTVGAGSPSWGTEVTYMQIRNTSSRTRGLNMIRQHMAIVAQYSCHKLHSVISPSNLGRFPLSQSQLKALKKTFRSMPVTSRGDQYWLRY